MAKVRLLLCGPVHVSNVAKCNLGKVILEPMLVSSFPNYAGKAGGGGDALSRGTSWYVYASVFAITLLPACHFLPCFSQPSFPLYLRAR